jgi:predicted component of type VI protein secretion system
MANLLAMRESRRCSLIMMNRCQGFNTPMRRRSMCIDSINMFDTLIARRLEEVILMTDIDACETIWKNTEKTIHNTSFEMKHSLTFVQPKMKKWKQKRNKKKNER